MLFKRFSRSRSNSNSYIDNYNSPHDSKTNSASYDDHNNNYSQNDRYSESAVYDDRRDLPSSRQSHNAPPFDSSRGVGKETSVDNMYPRAQMSRSQSQDAEAGQHGAGGAAYSSSASQQRGTNGYSSGGAVGGAYEGPSTASAQRSKDVSNSSTAAPDLLMQAFNQALRPHLDKNEQMEAEIADLRAYVAQLEQQQSEVHAWIDKRGLRPDVPANIATQMDSASSAHSPTHAAATLNAQLDRKITIVNFDLHRLQDDLNDALPTPSFSACMLKFLPDIARLTSLSSGPRYAFDLLLKLGGNLNSHGGLENGDEEDLAERRAFYGQLDEAMVDVVRGRFREEGDGWGVQREVKRIEKTGAYLRNWGVEPYFPQTLEVMRGESGHGDGGGNSAGQVQGSGDSYT